jgi:RIO kinase 2
MCRKMAISADDIRSLHSYEIAILRALERLMRRYRWVPLDVLGRSVGLSESEVMFRLGRLMEKGMVRYDTVPYEGYSLIFGGYDSLALSALATRGTVSALGCKIGEGKESVVYEGLGLGTVALKFHHVGQRSFQSVRLNRDYMPEQVHCPWIFASKHSAEREFLALKTLHPHVRVPLPIDMNRHVVVMEFIEGVTLNQAVVSEPEEVREEIIGELRNTYRLGIIHADFSEFNVMINERGCTIIDWPQWIGTDHPNAEAVLNHDLDTILGYFLRKYKLTYELSDVLACVTS